MNVVVTQVSDHFLPKGPDPNPGPNPNPNWPGLGGVNLDPSLQVHSVGLVPSHAGLSLNAGTLNIVPSLQEQRVGLFPI